MNKKILATSLLALSINSAADSLLDIYNDALENDPQYKSAEFSYLSGKEIKVQGRAGLLPNISINAQTNWNEYYQNGNLQNQYNNFSSSARLTQPLIRLDSWFKYRQSKFLTDAAEADFAYSQQALIVRTAELYFNVLRAIDLSAARSEEKAIKKQLDQIRQRYEVGLAAVTEVQEAQLAFDLSLASRTRVEGEVYTAKESLNALVGREIISLDGLVNDLNVSNPVPASKEEWARKAVENNFRLQAANLRKFASKNNARSVASNHLPKVDIVGVQSESETNQYSFDGLNTGGAFNITVPDETQRDTYSLQLSMPIFQGGAIISRTKQAYAESNKSSEDALFTERSVIQDVRSQYSNVVTLVANLRAQKQAVISASSALEATKVGYEVGTRNIVDLLQAEKNLYSAERNLSNAKYDYLITTLRLHLAAGTLSPENLIEINNLLG